MKIPFVGPTYQMDAVSFDNQRCVNFYPIASETGTSKSVTALRSVPGYELFCELGGGPIRGGIATSDGRCFFVSGSGFYEVFSDGTNTLHGTLNSFVSRCQLAENGTQVIIVDGTDGYIFTLGTNVFAQITDVDFPTPAISVDFIGGYFTVVKGGTAQFYISALFDGTSWDAADFTTVESSPDDLVGLIADHGNLWLFGKKTVKVYQNTGNADFPFEGIPGAIVQTGCADINTVQKFDNSIAWLGVDDQGRGVVWKADGYNALRFSTQAIEKKIATSEDFTDSFAAVYHEQGHIFYCLQVKSLDTTLVYDGATGMWHERQYRDTALGTDQQHKMSCQVFFAQKNLIGDRLNGKVYSQSLNLYSFDGEEIIRTRITPHLAEEKRMITHGVLELDMETGSGLVTGQGSDPQIMLQYSNDGGKTWSNELWKDIGEIGKYGTRVRWKRLGMARDRVYKVVISDHIFVQINDAYLNT